MTKVEGPILNIAEPAKDVKKKNLPPLKLMPLYASLPRIPHLTDRSFFPAHATINAWLKWQSKPEIKKALMDTGIDIFLSNFIALYFWHGRHFCYGMRALRKRWYMSDHTIKRSFVLAYYAGILEPIAKKVFRDSKDKGWLPVWTITKNATKVTPNMIYSKAKLLGFKCRSLPIR